MRCGSNAPRSFRLDRFVLVFSKAWQNHELSAGDGSKSCANAATSPSIPVQLLAERAPPGASLCDIAAELACSGCGAAEPAVWVVSEVGRHPADDRPEPTRMAVLLAGGEGV